MSKTAVSPQKFSRKKFKTMKFTGKYKELLGTPECSGSWIIFGDSGNGKTTTSLELLKYLTNFKKCAYVPLEEGVQLSFQQAFNQANLLSVSSQFKLWPDYTVKDLDEELSKPRAPQIIFIDSVQYLRMNDESYSELTKFEYMELLKRHPKTLFIFISHAKNNEPKGALAEAVYYGSHICMWVKDFVVYPKKNRFGGKTPLELNDK